MRISDWSSDVCSSDLRPDVVVGDFSPTLNLAARGRVPSIVVGNGYTIPPGGRPMPPIRPWQPALEAFSVTHEAELLATAHAALAARGAAPLGHPADALDGGPGRASWRERGCWYVWIMWSAGALKKK